MGLRPRTSPPRGMPGLVVARALLLMGVLLAGCGEDTGIVEVTWDIVDARIDPLSKTCQRKGERESSAVRYDLQVRLRVLEDADCEDSSCEVAQELFPCERTRGASLEVPTSEEDPYFMVVDVLVAPNDGERFEPQPECIAVPGPRMRRVRAGRVTDLGVYQFIAHEIDPGNDSERIDLDKCADPDFGEEEP